MSISNLDLRLTAELDNPVRWDAKEIGRRQRVAVHDLEQVAADAAEARMSGRDDLHSSDEERGLHHIECKTQRGAPVQHPRYIRLLHETVLGDNGVEVVPEIPQHKAPVRRHARD